MSTAQNKQTNKQKSLFYVNIHIVRILIFLVWNANPTKLNHHCLIQDQSSMSISSHGIWKVSCLSSPKTYPIVTNQIHWMPKIGLDFSTDIFLRLKLDPSATVKNRVSLKFSCFTQKSVFCAKFSCFASKIRVLRKIFVFEFWSETRVFAQNTDFCVSSETRFFYSTRWIQL